MSTVKGPGRLGNQITRSLAGLILAKKNNLKIKLSCPSHLKALGINIDSGKKTYPKTIKIHDDNYIKYFSKKNAHTENISLNGYFQTKLITDKIHKWLNEESISKRIIEKNKFASRYQNNTDCFIHIRLGDVEKWNPGFEYYNSIITKLPESPDIYIATDSPKHELIKKIQKNFGSRIKIINYELTDIMLFASTCKYVILSYGTFSAIIGYISYYSTVYCLRFCKKYAWDWKARTECDMFRDKSTLIGHWIVNG